MTRRKIFFLVVGFLVMLLGTTYVVLQETGDSDFIPGQMVDKFEFQQKNSKVLAEGGEPATAKPVFLGITRSS